MRRKVYKQSLTAADIKALIGPITKNGLIFMAERVENYHQNQYASTLIKL
jgi:hypothetical protein